MGTATRRCVKSAASGYKEPAVSLISASHLPVRWIGPAALLLAFFLVCSARPSVAQSNSVNAQFKSQDNYGVTQIIVDGQNLLLENGFHIIGGKKTGQDTQENNINSEDPHNRNGTMYPGGNPAN